MALRDLGYSLPSLGFHTPGIYVSLYGQLVRHGARGVLTIREGKELLRLYFDEGLPVWFEARDRTEVARDPSARLAHLRRGIAEPLLWTRGGWTFEASETLSSDLLEHVTSLDSGPLAPLWDGVRLHVGHDDVLGPVSDRRAGDVEPDPRLWTTFPFMGVDGPLGDLHEQLRKPMSVPELVRRYAQARQDLLKLLWMLEILGMVLRDGPREAALGMTPPAEDLFATSIHEENFTGEESYLDEPYRSSVKPSSPGLLSAAPVPGEWSTGPEFASLVRTEPSGTPSDVMPELPSYRPSRRTGPSTGRHARSSVKRQTNPNASREGLRSSHLSNTGSAPAAMSAAAVRKDYRTRMGRDYYTFLGVSQRANQSMLERSWTKLLKRWTAASKDKSLPEEARRMARELVQVTQLAGRTFSVPTRRQEYDRRLQRGQAPLAGSICGAQAKNLKPTHPGARAPTPRAGGGLAKAQELIAGQDFDHAVTFLKDLRLSQPSDPNVLASLGWAVWKSSGEANRTQAEEFLRLAASFAPQHVQAREYMARIALDAGDHEPARQRLEHLLAVKPDASWARAALNRLPPPDDGGGRRLAVWRK